MVCRGPTCYVWATFVIAIGIPTYEPDQSLSQTNNSQLMGLVLRDHGRVLLIACGALARVVLAPIKANVWIHVDLQRLPTIYHKEPNKIVPAVKALIEKYQSEYNEIFIIYADCGTGGQLQNLCDDMGV